MRSSFIGSTVAIVTGAISITTQLWHVSKWVQMDNIVGGVTAILGAVAYRLSKQRRLGLHPNLGMHRNVELVLLALVFFTPVVQTLMGIDFVTRPWSNFLIPIWTLIAYLFVRLRKTSTPVPSIR